MDAKELLKQIYYTEKHCKSFRAVPEILFQLKILKKVGMLNFTEKMNGVENGNITTAELSKKAITYMEDKEKVLVNIYNYENGNPCNFRCVADCFIGTNGRYQTMVQELKDENLIHRAAELFYTEENSKGISARHILTDEGYDYIEKNKLI